tara:strand:+ start:174 stop:872 length:699 start_codon:yes stop_codon:yes gene_type:complete
MASYETKEIEIETNAATEPGEIAETQTKPKKTKKAKKPKKDVDDDEMSDDSEGSLVDFIVKDDMIESEVEEDETSLADESEIKELFKGLENMDCANLIESSNFNSQGLRRSRRNTQQPVRFTEQYAADIAKTMLDDIPDDELSAALMDENDSLVDTIDSEDDDYNFNVESESESESSDSDSDFDSGASAGDGSDDDDDVDEGPGSAKSPEPGFKTPESKKSKLTLPGGHVLK